MNFPPANIYMGDSGSMFLGYCLAFLSVIFIWNPSSSEFWKISIQPVLLFFAIPIFDLAVVVISRISKGKSPMQGGVDHISHRLINLGQSEKRVIFNICLLNIYTLVMTFLIVSLNQLVSLLSLLFFIASFIIFEAYINREGKIPATFTSFFSAASKILLYLSFVISVFCLCFFCCVLCPFVSFLSFLEILEI